MMTFPKGKPNGVTDLICGTIIKYSKQSFVLSSQVNIINNRLYSFEITFWIKFLYPLY